MSDMKTLEIFENANVLEKALETTATLYHPHDHSWYLYHKVYKYADDKFSHDFIELAYATLSAWSMNSRAAKLSDFDIFEKSILQKDNLELLETLINENIIDLSKPNNLSIEKTLHELFNRLNLVSGKSLLVTFVKLLHFFFPKLIVPIDRKYTCTYFYGNTYVPEKRENQWKRFIEIEKAFSKFAQKNNKLKDDIEPPWNLCITKIMDNMIIGYMKQSESKKKKK
jgi:hypothetical protein